MGGSGPREERIAGTIFLPPAAAQTPGGWAHSPSCVFVFISPFSTPEPQEGPAPPPASGWPVPPRPAALPRPASRGASAGGPPIIPAGAHGGRHCRGGGGQLPAWLPSPPPGGWCGGGGALASQSPRPAGRGQGRRGLDLPSREAGAPPRVPRSRAGCCPGLLPLPGRPGIPGHPASSRGGASEGSTQGVRCASRVKDDRRRPGWSWGGPAGFPLRPLSRTPASCLILAAARTVLR